MSTKKRVNLSTPPRTPRELGLALRCVLYDMLVLAGALAKLHAWQEKRTHQGQRWVEAKVAEEAMLVGSRSLLDFLAPGEATRKDDITIRDFQRTPLVLPLQLESFRNFANKRCAHLTWERAKEWPLPTFSDISGTSHCTEDCSLWTLAQSCSLVRVLLDSGLLPEVPRHAKYIRELDHQLERLSIPPLSTNGHR